MGTNKPPNAEQNAFALNCSSPGLNKREYYAGLAMQAIIMADLKSEQDASLPISSVVTATLAVTYADALLAALNK